MERSEFHDDLGRMRDSAVVLTHLEAFETLWVQNYLGEWPKVFIPPALNHSFGSQTIQPILKGKGIDYVITRFSRVRQYAPFKHPCLAWESDVVLLNRGEALVPWNRVGATSVWRGGQPILPFHWGNLLHDTPGFNSQVVDGWVDLLKEPDIPAIIGEFWIKVQGNLSLKWHCQGAQILTVDEEENQTNRILVRPNPCVKKIFFSTRGTNSPEDMP